MRPTKGYVYIGTVFNAEIWGPEKEEQKIIAAFNRVCEPSRTHWARPADRPITPAESRWLKKAMETIAFND